MPLDDPLLPVSTDSVADLSAHLWVRHPAVQNIDAIAFTTLYDRLDLFFRVTFQPLRPQADLADLQAGVSQLSVPHEKAS